MRAVLAALAAVAAVTAFPACGYAEGAHGAGKRKAIRCPTKAKPKQRCPKLRQVIPIRSNGTVGRDVSLKAVAATVAPLPGVKPPKGGYPYIRSGSGPIRWVLRHWPKLTPGQRAAVQKALPGIAVPGATATAAGATLQTRPGTLALGAGWPAVPGRSARPPSGRASKFSLADLQMLVPKALQLLNARFEPDVTIPVNVLLGQAKNASAVAYLGSQGVCQIKVTPAGQSGNLTFARELILHELTHCYQYQLGFLDDVPWLDEGSAEWVGAVLGLKWSGSSSPDIGGWWKIYFTNFKQPLFQHAYSALGFYAQLAHTGSVAKVFQDLSEAYKLPDPKKQAYDVLVDAQALAFKQTTAPSGTRLKNLSPNWDTNGPGIPDATVARYDPPSVTIGVPVKAPAYGHAVVGLNPKSAAEVVKLKLDTPKSAWGMLHHDGGDDPLQSSDGNLYCADDKCKCPNGTKIQSLGDEAYLALYGYKHKAKVTLEHKKLKDACKFKTKVTVTGATNMNFTEAFCVAGSGQLRVEMPWSVNNVKMGHVTLEINGYSGNGTYTTGPSLATVDDFRPGSVNSWNLAQSGTIEVSSPGLAGGYGATGTVNTVSYRNDPYSVVLVAGDWTCGAPGSGAGSS